MQTGLHTEGHIVAVCKWGRGWFPHSVSLPGTGQLYCPLLSISHCWYLWDRCFCYRPRVSHSVCVLVHMRVYRFACEAPCFFFVSPPRASTLNRMRRLSENHGDTEVIL